MLYLDCLDFSFWYLVHLLLEEPVFLLFEIGFLFRVLFLMPFLQFRPGFYSLQLLFHVLNPFYLKTILHNPREMIGPSNPVVLIIPNLGLFSLLNHVFPSSFFFFQRVSCASQKM